MNYSEVEDCVFSRLPEVPCPGVAGIDMYKECRGKGMGRGESLKNALISEAIVDVGLFSVGLIFEGVRYVQANFIGC